MKDHLVQPHWEPTPVGGVESISMRRYRPKESVTSTVIEHKMPRVFEQAASILKLKWECKQCHQSVAEDCSVAYHLIDGVLYGWCESCFRQRPVADQAVA